MTSGFEMAKTENGKMVYQLLFELLDPKLVKFQFQMSAMRTLGDPITYFTSYPGRFIFMRLQGVDTNAPMPAPGGQEGARDGRQEDDPRSHLRPGERAQNRS